MPLGIDSDREALINIGIATFKLRLYSQRQLSTLVSVFYNQIAIEHSNFNQSFFKVYSTLILNQQSND